MNVISLNVSQSFLWSCLRMKSLILWTSAIIGGSTPTEIQSYDRTVFPPLWIGVEPPRKFSLMTKKFIFEAHKNWDCTAAKIQSNFISPERIYISQHTVLRNHTAGKHSNLKICTPLFMANDNQVGSGGCKLVWANRKSDFIGEAPVPPTGLSRFTGESPISSAGREK